MADTPKTKYHFLTGKLPVITKEFATDDEAIAEAKKTPGVIRVQHGRNLKHIYEAPAKETKAKE